MARARWLGSCPMYSIEAARRCSQEHLLLTWNTLHDIFRNSPPPLFFSLFLITFSFSDIPASGRAHGFAKKKPPPSSVWALCLPVSQVPSGCNY